MALVAVCADAYSDKHDRRDDGYDEENKYGIPALAEYNASEWHRRDLLPPECRIVFPEFKIPALVEYERERRYIRDEERQKRFCTDEGLQVGKTLITSRADEYGMKPCTQPMLTRKK